MLRTPNDPVLKATGLEYGFEPDHTFLGPVDLDIRLNSLHAVVGPNGAGKSTLLRLLIGLLSPRRGSVHLCGRHLDTYTMNERARRISFLPQQPYSPPDLCVEDVVKLGRHPYRGLRLFESPYDLAVVREAMQRTDTLQYASRPMSTLSGGEAQRVHLAAALAQEPQVLALDEPTSGLDLKHQVNAFKLLRGLASADGIAVIVVTHDLNLAAHYCDEVTVLADGKNVACGCPVRTLVAERLEPVYGVRFHWAGAEGTDRRWLVVSDMDAECGRGRR